MSGWRVRQKSPLRVRKGHRRVGHGFAKRRARRVGGGYARWGEEKVRRGRGLADWGLRVGPGAQEGARPHIKISLGPPAFRLRHNGYGGQVAGVPIASCVDPRLSEGGGGRGEQKARCKRR